MTDDFVSQLGGMIEEKVRSDVRQISERLASLIEMCASDHETILRERIFSLSHNALGERQPDVFRGFCDQISLAYGHLNPTDAEVLANSATPDVVRYLIRVLWTFRQFEGSNGAEAALARAMLASNPKGKPGRLKLNEVEIVDQAASAYRLARSAGLSRKGAERAALDSAYAVFRRGNHGEQDDRDVRRTRQKLRDLLVAEGVLASAGSKAPGG